MKLNCRDCPKTFKSQLALKYHKRKHDKPHICNICKCRFTSKDEIEMHAEKHNVDHEDIIRQLENESVSVTSDIKDREKSQSHMSSKGEKIVYQHISTANNCDVKENIRHTETVTEDNVKHNNKQGWDKTTQLNSKRSCKIQASQKLNQPLKHSKDTIANSIKLARETKNTSQNGDRKTNISEHGINSKEDCDRLQTEANYGEHMCHVCNKTYCSRSNLARHACKAEIGTKSEENETRTKINTEQYCEVCKKTYSTVTSFKHHSCKPKEDIIKKKTCKVCEKSFKTNEHFRQHMRAHTGERPYLCGSCGKSFSQQGNLIKHMRIHSGDRMFLCEVCSRPFMTKGALNEHIRVHSDEKGHQCEVCKKYFRHKHGLDNHQHKRKYPCNVRKYGENKLPKKKKKVKTTAELTKKEYNNVLGEESPANHVNAIHVTAMDNEVIVKSDTTSSQGSHVQALNIQDNATEYVAQSYTSTKSNLDTRSSVYSNMFGIEHSIQRLQNFTEVMLPRLQSENTVKIYDLDSNKSVTDENQMYRYNELQRSDIATDKTLLYSSTRHTNVTSETYQRSATSERVNKTHIDKILMQYYNDEINPTHFDKDYNKCVDVSDLRTHSVEVNNQSLNAQVPLNTEITVVNEPLSDRRNQKVIVQHNYEYSENSFSVQNPNNANAVFIKQQIEEPVFAIPMSYQTNLSSHSGSPSSMNEIGQEKSTETLLRETLPKDTVQPQMNEILERNRNLNEGSTNDDTSEFDSEDVEISVGNMTNQQYKRMVMKNEIDTFNMPCFLNDSTCNTDTVSGTVTDSVTQENDGLCQANIETDAVAKSDRHRPTVEMSEEEVLKIIEKARCKDFKCENCDRNFSNDYCLLIHSCKLKNSKTTECESKKVKERKFCKLCERSYANKYLLAYHSCRPTKKSERQSKMSKIKQQRQKKDSTEKIGTEKGQSPKCDTNNYLKRRFINGRESRRHIIQANAKVTLQTRRKNKENKTVEAIVAENEENKINGTSTQRNKEKNMDMLTLETMIQNNSDHKVDEQTEHKSRKNPVTDNKSSKNLEMVICEVCGKTYKNNINLKKHSCKPPPKTCKVCGKRFNLSGHLQIHMRIHTGDLPFLCKVCGKQFNQRANLMKHLRIHNPEKLFKCEICDRRFTQKGALTEHRIVHTNIKPYVCLKCDKSFRHKHGLQNHQRRKFPCDKVKDKWETGNKSKQKGGSECEQRKDIQTDAFHTVELLKLEGTINHQSQLFPTDVNITEDQPLHESLECVRNHQTQPVPIEIINAEDQPVTENLETPNIHSDQVLIQVNIIEDQPVNERFELLTQQPQERYDLCYMRPQFVVNERLT